MFERRCALHFLVLLVDVAGVLDADDGLFDHCIGFGYAIRRPQCFT